MMFLRLSRHIRSPHTRTGINFPSSQIHFFSTSPEFTASTKDILSSAIDDLSEIKRVMDMVSKKRDWSGLKRRYNSLQEELKSDSIWTDSQKATQMQIEASKLRELLDEFESYKSRCDGSDELLDLARQESDTALLDDLSTDLSSLKASLSKYYLHNLMCEEADKCGCFLELRAGAGGVESCDWVSILSRMYMKWGVEEGYQCKIVDEVKGDVAGLKSITMEFAGEYAHGWAQFETGIHRLVRCSPFDSAGKRHTSFASVQVFPIMEENTAGLADIDLSPGDLKIETMRAQGAGGQHVNKTESAIRIVHLPTNISVYCQSQRSQHQNKAKAMQLLKARLYERQLRKAASEKAEQYADLSDNGWGNQIRSYVLQPYQMIKDLRTGHERGDVTNVLEGDLSGFLEASLVHFRMNHGATKS